MPGTVAGTPQRSSQGSKTAAGRQRAMGRAQTLTARTVCHPQGRSKASSSPLRRLSFFRPVFKLSRLVSAGKLDRIARGIYSLPGRALSEHRSLAEAALRVPRGAVCLLSTLRIHGIGTQAPFEAWLAIPHHSPTPRLDQPALRVVRMSGTALTEGVEPFEVDGVKVPVFNAAKTVVDCFKYRNKIGLDVALEALHDGWSRRKLTMDALWHYARVDRVVNVMRPYLESVTA
ncbi:type IV toxin-antitoxin system AbiEi family antitoxin domain-containing protein [Variovorax sp. W2I14]|uniref:type IV toxin-antitoxin system AbiEi family antitoxin domain-containing protein n=1 Tax=Variovorax sp. W2I14 TaxID=3042290 RepID=UPI003D254752